MAPASPLPERGLTGASRDGCHLRSSTHTRDRNITKETDVVEVGLIPIDPDKRLCGTKDAQDEEAFGVKETARPLVPVPVSMLVLENDFDAVVAGYAGAMDAALWQTAKQQRMVGL